MCLKIRNRDKKSGKMFKNGQKLTGLVLLLSGLLLGIIHILFPLSGYRDDYRTGQKTYRETDRIPTVQNGSIRVNTAGTEELEMLPGIGKVYASMLIEEREKNGIFFYPEDLTAVKGIGKGKLEKIYQDIDLTMEKGEKDGVSSTIP